MTAQPGTVEACAREFLLALSAALGTFSTELGGVIANPPLLATLTTKEGLSLAVTDTTGRVAVAVNPGTDPADVTLEVGPGRTLVINGETFRT